ncbi:MAG TPA: hypothetical protein VG737_07480 [Cyclobacteriaceae bacterium]|nr:hypothetical protein [Cyclobacteriaceae bacterium]
MGLVMLIRDNQGDVNEVLPHLLKAAEELDAVIKKIVTKTETVGLLDKE